MKLKALRIIAATPLMLALSSLSLKAQAVDWDNGSGDGLWSSPSNWSTDVLPGTTNNVLVTVANGSIKTITLDGTPVNGTVLEVGLARTGNGTATVNHTGGTLTVTGWFNLGQGFGASPADGTGVWNMTGSSVVNATHASAGLTTIGAGWTTTGYNTGILNIGDSARFNNSVNAIHVGGELANLRARGVINLTGSGTLSNTAATLVGVAANGSTGIINVGGSSTLTSLTLLLGTNNGATGAIRQTGGTVSTTQISGNTLSIGNATGGFGSYQISGGSLTTSEVSLGANGGGSGIMDISGANTSVTNTGWFVMNRSEGTGSAAQSSVLNVSGGSLTFAGGGLVTNWGASTANAQTSTINLSGTGAISTTNNTGINLSWVNNANNVATLNLNGGTATVNGVTGARGFVNLNGGVLRATANNAAYLAVNSAQVRSGGAIFDTNGFNITVAQALLAPSGNGVTTIEVTNGGSGYVSAPILTLTGGTGSGATAVANMVDDGTGNGTFRIGSITITGAGNYTVAPTTITATGGAPTTAATFGTISTATNTSGGLTKNGAGTLTMTGRNTFTGNVVINAGTLYANPGNAANNGAFSFVSGIEVKSGATLRAGANALFGWDASQAKTLTLQSGAVAISDLGVDVNVGTVVLNGGELQGNHNGWVWGSWGFGRNAAEKTLRVTDDSIVSASGVTLTRDSFVEVAADKTLNFSGTIINANDAVSQWSKTGAGTMILGGTNTYTGTTTVTGGTLIVNGSIAANTTTTVQTGATIGGSGSVGNLTIAAGGSINPGNSPGVLTVNGAYNQAGTLIAEIGGLTAGTDHDQVRVNGSVTLSGSLSTMFTGGSYQVNDLIFLVLNDGSDSISGTFSGLAQNSYVTSYGGMDWFISYNADSAGNTFTGGNDVALRAIPEPSAALLGGLGALALLRRRRKDVA